MGHRGVIALLALVLLAAPAQADSVQFSAQDGGKIRFGWIGNEVVYYSPPPVYGHWDPSDTSTLTIDASPDVGQVDDISGNDRDLTQATAAYKPHTGASIGGLNALDMQSGTVVGIFNSDPPTEDVGEFWIVYEMNALTYDGGVVCGTSYSVDTSAAWVILQPLKSSDYGVIQAADDGGNQVHPDSGYTQSTGVTYVYRGASTGSAYAIRVNGTDYTLTAHTGADDGDWNDDQSPTPDRIGYGMHYGTTPNFSSDNLAGEFLWLVGATPSWQVDAIDTYLRRKWGQS